MIAQPVCPVCWHEDTIRARELGEEPHHDDPVMLTWHRPYGGAQGQQLETRSRGHWSCEQCGLSISPRAAVVLIDAALTSDPGTTCDSFDGVMFADALTADRGGR